jgi:hypothetical protein
MTKPILIAGHARSGTTYVCQLLGCCNGIKPYLEIFHYDVEQIKRYFGSDWLEIQRYMNLPENASESRNIITQRSSEYLHFLNEINPNSIVSFKVFPGHLSLQQIFDAMNEISSVLLIRRNLLQTYISNEISIKLQKWSSIDTSKEKINFSAKHFVDHVLSVTSFYQSIIDRSIFLNLPLAIIDYEDLVLSDKPDTIIIDNLHKCCGFQTCCDLTRINITKQDNRKYAVDKVSNPDEMVEFLLGNDLMDLNDSTLKPKDELYSWATSSISPILI